MDMALNTKNKFTKFVLLSLLLIFLSSCSPASSPTAAPTLTPTPEPTPTPTPEPTAEWERSGWNLIWQDELDPEKWEMEIGGHGWGNNEKQFYTMNPENVRLEDGNLVIEARNEFFVRRHYTSGRIKTQGLFTFTYGRVEGRMKLPYGQGIWPAFWMLGDDIDEVGWPLCGEIDIMEHIGREPRTVYGTVHGPGYSGSAGIGHFTTFPAGALTEEFHVFAIEWEPNEIRWYVDDELFFTLTDEQVTGEWVFDHPFFILINMAVGGYWPGNPDETTEFPQFFTVDYVRVYQKTDSDG